jgi:hypothetical protein
MVPDGKQVAIAIQGQTITELNPEATVTGEPRPLPVTGNSVIFPSLGVATNTSWLGSIARPQGEFNPLSTVNGKA